MQTKGQIEASLLHNSHISKETVVKARCLETL